MPALLAVLGPLLSLLLSQSASADHWHPVENASQLLEEIAELSATGNIDANHNIYLGANISFRESITPTQVGDGTIVLVGNSTRPL